ncbi:MAG: flagellar basal body L-ring protein FlgH [Phycisphaerae bacterium]
MKRNIFTTTALLLLAAGLAQAGSIWRQSHKRTASLYRDDKASSVGDIVTIVINERTSIDNTSDRKLDKTDKRDLKVTGGAQLDLLRGLDAVTGKLFNLKHLDFSTDSSTNFDGQTEFGSKRSFQDEITVVVEDVLPNGNLVVAGKQVRKVQGETQTTQVSGVLRPSDISYDNKISSRRVANFYIVTDHTGQENQFTRPGWLAQILNFLNPF